MPKEKETIRGWLIRKPLEAAYNPKTEVAPDPEEVDQILRTAENRIRQIKNIEREMLDVLESGEGRNSGFFRALDQEYALSKRDLRQALRQLEMMERILSKNKGATENVNSLARITDFLRRPLKRGRERFEGLPERFTDEVPIELLDAMGWRYYGDAKGMSPEFIKGLVYGGNEIAYGRRKGTEKSPAPLYLKKIKKGGGGDSGGDDDMSPSTVKIMQY